MTTPSIPAVSSDVIYAIEDAVTQHTAAMEKAKGEWRAATHPAFKPTPAAIAAANERYRVAFNASLRVYLARIRDIDDGR